METLASHIPGLLKMSGKASILILLALQSVHWFNPLVWLAFHRLRVDRELACDALALSHARANENESYGLTILKLLEGFGQSSWAPSLARILETKQQIKERMSMIGKFHKTNRSFALALSLFAGLALVALTDAQNVGKPGAPANVARANGPDSWDLQQKLQAAEGGNKWAAFELWEAYYRGKHEVQTDKAQADKWLGEFIKNVSVVKFEPVGDFAPATPKEFLQTVNRYASTRSGRNGVGLASFFRTTKKDGKLMGSFLSETPDQLKAALSKVPNLKVISSERITPDAFIKYEKSKQESL